jgi:hypothetical protein
MFPLRWLSPACGGAISTRRRQEKLYEATFFCAFVPWWLKRLSEFFSEFEKLKV